MQLLAYSLLKAHLLFLIYIIGRKYFPSFWLKREEVRIKKMHLISCLLYTSDAADE